MSATPPESPATAHGHSHAASNFVAAYKTEKHTRNPQYSYVPPYLLNYKDGETPATHETRRQRFGVLSARAGTGKDRK